MLARITVVLLNTYREAVRARVLHGLFALALATAAYCVVVGQFASGEAARVLSNLGSASVALYGVFVAIVLSATALHREIELKTLFPILARPIARWEYVLGKYLGTLLTLGVFVIGNAAVFLLALAATGAALSRAAVGLGAGLAVAVLVAWRVPRARGAVPPALAVALMVWGAWLCRELPDDRRVILCSAVLTFSEVGIVAAISLLFSAFSSPFLSAIFTFGVFIVGRSADTLANLPVRSFGQAIHDAARALSHVVPNLMLYVPERAVLTGESAAMAPLRYTALAVAQAVGWAAVLLAFASLLFKRRDLT